MIILKIFHNICSCNKLFWFIIARLLFPLMFLSMHLIISRHICMILTKWWRLLLTERHLILVSIFISFTENEGLLCWLEGILQITGIYSIARLCSISGSLFLLNEYFPQHSDCIYSQSNHHLGCKTPIFSVCMTCFVFVYLSTYLTCLFFIVPLSWNYSMVSLSLYSFTCIFSPIVINW